MRQVARDVATRSHEALRARCRGATPAAPPSCLTACWSRSAGRPCQPAPCHAASERQPASQGDGASSDPWVAHRSALALVRCASATQSPCDGANAAREGQPFLLNLQSLGPVTRWAFFYSHLIQCECSRHNAKIKKAGPHGLRPREQWCGSLRLSRWMNHPPAPAWGQAAEL
jgi:hypothetical protein